VYSIDRKSSFRVALRTLEELRGERRPQPILLVGNKIDLERKRSVLAQGFLSSFLFPLNPFVLI
jgi:GTPase SAR1 family protein